MNDATLRAALVSLLKGGVAHLTLDGALEGFRAHPARQTPPPASTRSGNLWSICVPTRRTFLRYTTDPAWESPPWPEALLAG